MAVSKARRKEVAGAPPPSPSREPVRRALLVLITLLLRLPFIARFDFVSFDGTYYLSQAKALLHGSLSGGAFPLGYPLLIAPVGVGSGSVAIAGTEWAITAATAAASDSARSGAVRAVR